MNETHNHIILYAKGHYARPNFTYDARQHNQQIEDLKYICSVIYEYEYDAKDIWHHLTECLINYVEPNYQLKFLNELFLNDNFWKVWENKADYGRTVARVLSLLSITRVKDNPKMDGLGKPDYAMFPKLAKKKE